MGFSQIFSKQALKCTILFYTQKRPNGKPKFNALFTKAMRSVKRYAYYAKTA